MLKKHFCSSTCLHIIVCEWFKNDFEYLFITQYSVESDIINAYSVHMVSQTDTTRRFVWCYQTSDSSQC